MSRPRVGLAVAAAVLTLGGLVIAAGNSDGDSSAAPRAQGPVATPAAATSAAAPTVRYAGPRGRLSGPVELRARARGRVAVAAVTFTLDGRPIGSDTSAPYTLDVHAARLPAGQHRIAVTAVDRLGRRRTTRSTAVTVRGGSDGALRAGPNSDLRPVLARLRRGNVTVRLGPGRYELADVELGSGATLVGSGPDTVIAAPSGVDYRGVLLPRGSRIRVSDLTVDGGGPGPGTGSNVLVWQGSRDVRLQRLSLVRVRTDGVHTWGAHKDVTVQDSSIDGAGTGSSGVLLRGSEGSEDASVIRTRVRGFLNYGVNFSFNELGSRRGANQSVALDNEITDIDNPQTESGRNESALWNGGVRAALIGNTIARTGWTGIETVGSSTGLSVVRNRITQTRTGIYLEHSTNDSLFASNQISQVRNGFTVEWRYGGVGSNGNRFTANRVAEAFNAGIFVDTGSDMNLIERNVYTGGGGRAIVLQGSSGNRIVGNRGCGDPVVHQQAGRFDDGSLAVPRGNVVADNRSLGC